MSDHPLPATDLDALRRDVLDGPSNAALPAELSDRWLDLISRDLEQCLSARHGDDGEGSMVGPVALVLHLLRGKFGERQFRLSYEELELLLRDYRLEISLERITRCTDIKVGAATLATIFSKRELSISHLGSPTP